MTPPRAPQPTPADLLVRDGFAAQRAGDAARAEATLNEALRLQPEHPDALQLLAMLARERGQGAVAEDLLRRSLRARPAQPTVWNKLGNLLHAGGRSVEALACYEQALALDARAADAHFNRARVLHALARNDLAAQALEQAVAASGRADAPALQLQAQIESAVGQPTAALATLDRALALAPERAALWHNRAAQLQQLHRHADALAAHQQAAALGLDAADAHYNLGNTLQSLGRHADAQAAYRRALAREPAHALALYDLARLRWRLGDADFDAELRAALLAQPAAGLARIHGHLLWRAERFAHAADAYRQALRGASGDAAAHDGLGRCLVRLGDVGAGLAAHARAVALAPQDVELRSNHAASLLVAGRIEAARDEAEAACAVLPAHQYAQSLRHLAWRVLGDARAAWLADPARDVRMLDLEPPPGWPDMGRFNAALAAELAAMHADRQAPIDQTLRGGTQTVGDIFEQGHPLVDALKARIAQAVSDHIAALPAEAGHPFLGRRGAGWRFADSWSSRLQRQGFHTDHVHPHGWISSAYYVQVPPVCADPARREGWLQFGRPDLALPGIDPASLVQRIEPPRPGRLALFPSLLWHGTTPFHDDAARLTIAFDVVPVDDPPA